MNSPIWIPSNEKIKNSLMYKFMKECSEDFNSYFDLHSWSINNLEDFWANFWRFSDIKYSKNYNSVLENPVMPGAKWFSGSELNYSQNLLKGDPDQIAIISIGENISPKTFLNIGFSGQNAMIRSAELGLESHPIGGWDEDKVKEISNIPSDSQVAFLLVIGKEGKIDMLSKELLEKHNKQRERNPLDINFNFDEWGKNF